MSSETDDWEDYFYGSLPAGYLIVRSYSWLLEWYLGSDFFHDPGQDTIYALPQRGWSAENVSKQYAGTDRLALSVELNGAYGDDEEPAALDALWEFDTGEPPPRGLLATKYSFRESGHMGRSKGDFLFNLADAQSIFSMLQRPERWEIIWAARTDMDAPEPEGAALLGYEPAYFYPDHFSAIADCMCFPRWHGCDPEGTLFRDYFERLNRHALFDTAREAQEYLDFYLSLDWTEHAGGYHIAKVMAV